MRTDTLINIEEHIRNFSDVLLDAKTHAKNFGIPLSDALSIFLLFEMKYIHDHFNMQMK